MKGRGFVSVTTWSLAVSDDRLAALRHHLSPDESARADRARVKSVAHDFIASRGIAREVLSEACGQAPGAISFGTGPRGKPYLAHAGRPFAFNLSHSGGHCALAMGDVGHLGVDIEAVRPTIGDLAQNIFTQREVAQFSKLGESDRVRAFFRAWVAKEAYLKATGEGLGGGLKSLELSLTLDPNISVTAIRGDSTALSNWKFLGFDLGDTIFGAVAVECGDREIDFSFRTADT